jgi:hypothetical protein
MGYGNDIYDGFGFALGDLSEWGYGQGEVWTTTLKDYAEDTQFEDLIEADYPLLEVAIGGDLTIEAIIYLIDGSHPDRDENPSDAVMEQLEAFASRFNLAMTPVWHEWVTRS